MELAAELIATALDMADCGGVLTPSSVLRISRGTVSESKSQGRP